MADKVVMTPIEQVKHTITSYRDGNVSVTQLWVQLSKISAQDSASNIFGRLGDRDKSFLRDMHRLRPSSLDITTLSGYELSTWIKRKRK